MSRIKEVIKKQRSFFAAGRTKDLDFRREKLKLLREVIIENEKQIMEALKKDLNKAPFEAYATEIGFVLEEIKYTLKHLAKWVKPKKVKTPLILFPSSSYIYSEPYGVIAIMAPWNYPFQLVIAPLVGAIAAGNCSILKPSEYSPHTSALIDQLIRENFDESFIAVIQGGRDVNQKLLEEKLDYIFFTGSVAVGKIVMEAAAKHLTPITLELGGKSPGIIDDTANIDLAARRIAWGKFLNAGQTCVAPDYLLVYQGVKDELINKIAENIRKFYSSSPLANQDYPKIINQKHFNRLLNLMQSGNIVFGGQYDDQTMQIAPTIIDEITLENPIMQEEIFGPLLPVLEYESLTEALSVVNNHPKPLALYLFTTDKKTEQYVINSTSFGGGCINDTIIHLVNPYLTFGGVGESGIGGYHGKASFDTFSHKKSVMKKSNLLDIPLRYPPFKNNLRLLKKVMK